MSLHGLPCSKYISFYIPWVFGCSQSCCKDHLPPQEATAPALHHIGRQTQNDFHSGKVLKMGKRGWKLLGIANQLWDLPKPPGFQLKHVILEQPSGHVSFNTTCPWVSVPKWHLEFGYLHLKKEHFSFTNPHYSYISQYLSYLQSSIRSMVRLKDLRRLFQP